MKTPDIGSTQTHGSDRCPGRFARLSTLALVLLTLTGISSVAAQKRVRQIEVDYSKPMGTIRALHGVNNGPYSEGFTVDLSKYFLELRIPHVRLHEPNYPARGSVHLQSIFPDMNADPSDPRNYNFRDTDDYIAAVIAVGAKPIYNLGMGNRHHDVRGPTHRNQKISPADYPKIAQICANIVRHYNEGWANGFKYGIEYWDIWNEPNGRNHWSGTFEEFVDLYAAVAGALKATGLPIKIGGPGLAPARGNADFAWLDKFLAKCRERDLPLDFCSWHSYDAAAMDSLNRSREVQRLLDRHGFTTAENHLTEWSPTPLPFAEMRASPLVAREFFERTGNNEGASFDLSVLCFLQDSAVDVAAFYSGDTLRWALFDRNGAPRTSFYAFKAFQQMLETDQRAFSHGTDLQAGLAVLAGTDRAGRRAQLLISNHQAECDEYEVRIRGLSWTGGTAAKQFRIDKDNLLAPVETPPLQGEDLLVFRIPAGKASITLLEFSPAH